MACRSVLRSPLLSTLPRVMSSTTRHMSDVKFTQSGSVGIITLDRQRALNAINSGMVADITRQLLEWRMADDVGVVCIEGAGEKAFCAGGDVVSITSGTDDPATALQFFSKEFQMNHLIGTYPKPYVALIHGITMGGGVGLSVHGKYRIATDKSLYAMPETAIGYFPDVGGSYFLSRLPQPYGMFLGLTGHRLKGGDLKHLGIATHYIHSDKLAELKRDLLHCDKDSLTEVLSAHDTPTPQAFSLTPHEDIITSCFTDAGSVPDIISRLQGAARDSEFAGKLITTLSRMSPRSLAVTHRLLSLAPTLSYEECFAMELNAAHTVVESGEFSEGVRALLVDKDNSPRWEPPTLEGITEEMVEQYFVRREPGWEPLKL